MDTLSYVVDVPFFWITMGMVGASAAFCGTIILNGHLDVAWRSLLTKIIYITFLFQINFFRVTHEIEVRHLQYNQYSYATIVAMAIMTVFWIFGMLVGIYTSHFVKQKYRGKSGKTNGSLDA